MKKIHLQTKSWHIIIYLLGIAFFLAPIFRLFLLSLKYEQGYSWMNYILLLQEERTKKAILNTIIVAIFSSCIATILGTIYAFLIAYTNIMYKKIIEVLVILPFIIPSYIITLSWSTLLSQKGFLNQTLKSLGMPMLNIYSMAGIILVLGFCNIPLVYMNVIHTLKKIPIDMQWASSSCGYNTWQTVFHIYVKQAIPSIAGGSILAFLSAIDNFSVPAFLGISSGIPILSTYIYEKAIAFGPSGFAHAATLSIILSLIALVGIFLASICIRKVSFFESIKEDSSIRIYFTEKVRKNIQKILFFIVSLVNIVPLLSMFMSAFQKNYGLRWSIKECTVLNFVTILKNKSVLSAMYNSLELALTCCAVCIILGTVVAYKKVRTKAKITKFIEESASLTYSIPGIVLALAMIFHWVEPLPGVRPGFYGTRKILVIAYITRYLILQIKGSTAAMMSIEPALEEAAISSGRGKWDLWTKILFPLLIKPVISSTFIIFILAFTELTLSSILAAAGSRTIGLMIFNFQQAGDYGLASSMSTIIVLFILTVYMALQYEKKKKRKKECAHESVYRKNIKKFQPDPSIG